MTTGFSGKHAVYSHAAGKAGGSAVSEHVLRSGAGGSAGTPGKAPLLGLTDAEIEKAATLMKILRTARDPSMDIVALRVHCSAVTYEDRKAAEAWATAFAVAARPGSAFELASQLAEALSENGRGEPVEEPTPKWPGNQDRDPRIDPRTDDRVGFLEASQWVVTERSGDQVFYRNVAVPSRTTKRWADSKRGSSVLEIDDWKRLTARLEVRFSAL